MNLWFYHLLLVGSICLYHLQFLQVKYLGIIPAPCRPFFSMFVDGFPSFWSSLYTHFTITVLVIWTRQIWIAALKVIQWTMSGYNAGFGWQQRSSIVLDSKMSFRPYILQISRGWLIPLNIIIFSLIIYNLWWGLKKTQNKQTKS